MMNIQKIAKWFGVITLLLGVLGFVPGIVAPGGFLFGIFLVSILVNIVHIIVGLVGIESAMSVGAAKLYFKIVGGVFAVMAILDFTGTILTTNTAGSILAVVAALIALYFGFRAEPVTVSAPAL